jgi:hypothetical protein
MTSNSPSQNQGSLARLVLAPAIITFAVTLLRLAGELNHWRQIFFARGMGASLIGITWLAPVMGIYFARSLEKAGAGPESYLRAVGRSLLGVVVMLVLLFLPSVLRVQQDFYSKLLHGWVLFMVAAIVTRRGWPQLFTALLAYGFAARIPVAILMFFAFRNGWGTHYDAVPPGMPEMGLLGKYLWLGFFPQLTLWVALTVLAGMLFGTIFTGIRRLVRIERGLPI